jgi:hypothetical protein
MYQKKEVTFVIAKGREVTVDDLAVFELVEGKKFIVTNKGDICNPSERFTGVTRLINLTGRSDIDEFYKDILIQAPKPFLEEVDGTADLASVIEDLQSEVPKKRPYRKRDTPAKV